MVSTPTGIEEKRLAGDRYACLRGLDLVRFAVRSGINLIMFNGLTPHAQGNTSGKEFSHYYSEEAICRP